VNYLKPIFGEMDCFIAMSDDMRRDLIGIGCPEEKIVVHYHGIDTDRFSFPERTYPDRDRVNILLCGRIEPKKAHAHVLRALRMWEERARRPGTFEVTIMGSGPLREPLEKLVHDYGWQDRVRLLGHVPHGDPRLVDEYRRADIFAQPSVTADGEKEGIPGTIVEAMACGLPVVSTYHAGIPELIRGREDGLLVEEGDFPALSEALGSLIEDRSLREQLGRAAARTASTRCRLSARTRHLELIYDQVASRSARRER
jgi:colanic acid/amylovoran biosynthesis glycosyltransferase